MDGVAQKLLVTLRRVAPFRVRAYDGSDEARDIAVPQRRRKWAQVIETIEAKAWVRVVMLDKSGAELAYVENDGAATAIEDIGTPEAVAKGSREKWLLELMLRAQDVSLKNRDSEFRAIMSGMRDLMQTQNEAMRGVFQLLAIQRDISADIARSQAKLEVDENADDLTKMLKLLEAGPDLIKTLGPAIMMAKAAMGKKPPTKPPTPPNGQPKPDPVS